MCRCVTYISGHLCFKFDCFLTILPSNSSKLLSPIFQTFAFVFPETNCQGLFNQIHKKSTKRCQKHRMAPDTSFDRLHFSVQQVFAEIRIVWQLVDIWLPAPLDFRQFQRIGFLQCMIVACHIQNIRTNIIQTPAAKIGG